MAASSQQGQAVLLEDLPPELLGKIVDLCADDMTVGRTTLLSLSVMNKYLRNVTAPRLFERICFRDGPESPGDEILHSIRRFKASPELGRHTRAVSLYLNRLKFLGEWPHTLSQPYHYLVLPEFVNFLVAMPGATELYIRLGGGQGAKCLDGLHAVVHWCSAGRKLNIRSLTVSTENLEDVTFWDCQECFEYGFLGTFSQVEAFCYDGGSVTEEQVTWPEAWSGSITTAPNLTRLRMYQARSDPRTDFRASGWYESRFLGLNLCELTPELEYLSVLGELEDFPVWQILNECTKIPKLKYLDITDEQRIDLMREWDSVLAMEPSDRLACIKYLARIHLMNEDRSKLARETFNQCTNLRRICFVRSCIGEVYLRGYPEAVADSTGYVSPDINDADLIEIPERWLHGVPQTDLVPFPGFTPWEGIEEAKN